MNLSIHVAGPCPMWNILEDPTCDLHGEIAWEGERRTKRRQLFTRVLYARITKNPPRFVLLLLVSNVPPLSNDLTILLSMLLSVHQRRWKRKSRVSRFFPSPSFFFFLLRLNFTNSFPSSSSSSFLSIKRRENVSDRHADRERSGRDVGCEQPRVQLPGKGFQG